MSLIQTTRDRLKKSGLTQMEIRDGSGVPQASISRFMIGKEGISGRNLDALVAFMDRLDKAKRKAIAAEKEEQTAEG